MGWERPGDRLGKKLRTLHEVLKKAEIVQNEDLKKKMDGLKRVVEGRIKAQQLKKERNERLDKK